MVLAAQASCNGFSKCVQAILRVKALAATRRDIKASSRRTTCALVVNTRNMLLELIPKTAEVPFEAIEDPGTKGTRHCVECIFKRPWLELRSYEMFAIVSLRGGDEAILVDKFAKLFGLKIKQASKQASKQAMLPVISSTVL